MARHDWQTPRFFIDLVREVAPIALDPCSAGKMGWGAKNYIESDDGLTKDWYIPPGQLFYCNPPYGRALSDWSRKIISSCGPGIALVPVRTDAAWWVSLFSASLHCVAWRSPVFGTRIQFVNPDTGKPGEQNNHASCVFYFGEKGSQQAAKFVEVFSKHGLVLK